MAILWAYGHLPARAATPQPPLRNLLPPEPAPIKSPRPVRDRYGDLLPPGAVQRLGSLRAAEDGKPPRGHLRRVMLAAFSPDGRAVASRDGDQVIHVWDVGSGRVHWTLGGHEGRILSMVFSPDGKMLATASPNEVIQIWNTQSGQRLKSIAGGASVARFTADGKQLVYGDNGVYFRFDLAGGKQVSRDLIRTARVPLALSPDGSHVAAVSRTFGTSLWYVSLTERDKTDGAPLQRELRGAGRYPNVACFSGDGMTLAAGGSDHTIHLWDVVTGTLTHQLKAHEGTIHHVAFSPDGRVIATASRDETVRLWEVISGSEIVALDAHQQQARAQEIPLGNVNTVAFSPDARRLVSGGMDRALLVWDVRAVTALESLDAKSIDDATARRLWKDLAEKDARLGYRALASLAGWGENLAPFAESRLKGTLVAAQDERILSLIAQLDADDFPTREKATRELVKIRGIADALLRMTLVATESAEVRHRIETILQTPLPPVKISPEELRRMVRLVEALERSGDRSSVAFLATLGKSYPAPVIQGEALRALGRLGSE